MVSGSLALNLQHTESRRSRIHPIFSRIQNPLKRQIERQFWWKLSWTKESGHRQKPVRAISADWSHSRVITNVKCSEIITLHKYTKFNKRVTILEGFFLLHAKKLAWRWLVAVEVQETLYYPVIIKKKKLSSPRLSTEGNVDNWRRAQCRGPSSNRKSALQFSSQSESVSGPSYIRNNFTDLPTVSAGKNVTSKKKKKSKLYLQTYAVIAECNLEQRHPRWVIRVVERWFYTGKSLVQKVERLGETEQDDHVYDAKGQHVAGYHTVDHRDERPGQSYCSANEIKPNVIMPSRYNRTVVRPGQLGHYPLPWSNLNLAPSKSSLSLSLPFSLAAREYVEAATVVNIALYMRNSQCNDTRSVR